MIDILYNLKKKLFSNNLSIFIRNFLSYRPSIYYNANNKNESISDFFYWTFADGFETKFILTNICSQVLPDLNQNDNVSIYIFDNNGNFLKKKEILLIPFETRFVKFNDEELKGKYGSFFVFHKFLYFGDLIKNKCHIAERGYTGFRKNNGLWNFVHGNHYAAALSQKNNIYSLLSFSIFKTFYNMQLSFNDAESYSIILNNPSKKKIKIELLLYSNDNSLVKIHLLKIKSLCTEVIKLSDSNFKYLKIKSNIMMCRPILMKNYKTYFDILHT